MKNTRAYRYLRGLEQKLGKNIRRFRLKRRLRNATPVFIFQMGKVEALADVKELLPMYS